MVCVAIALLIYGGSMAAEAASADLQGVTSAAGREQPLPMAYLSQLTAEPGVGAVGRVARLRGYAEVETNTIAISAVDPGTMAQVNGAEIGLAPDLLTVLGTDRDRVLVGQTLAKVQGWTVGHQITVTVPDMPTRQGTHDWQFEVAGIFEGASASSDTYFVMARYDYINAMRARGTDRVDAFVVRPAGGLKAAVLGRQIDALFANSAAPTRTQSEK